MLPNRISTFRWNLSPEMDARFIAILFIVKQGGKLGDEGEKWKVFKRWEHSCGIPYHSRFFPTHSQDRAGSWGQ